MLKVIRNDALEKQGWSIEDIVSIRIIVRPVKELTERVRIVIRFATALDLDNIPFFKGRLANERVFIHPRRISENIFGGIVLPWEMNLFDEDQHEQIMTGLITAIGKRRQIVFSLIIDQKETLFTLTDLEYQKDRPHLRVVPPPLFLIK